MKLEKTKAFGCFILFGIICVALGVVLLPAWADEGLFFSGWGVYSVNITISGLILGYILFYLIKRVKRYSNTPAQIVSIVELVVMAIIAFLCTASLFIDSLSLGEPCQIFAIVVWARGVSGVFTGYYCDSSVVKAAEDEKRARKKGDEVELNKLLEAKNTIDTKEQPKGRVDDFTVWRLVFAVALISTGTYLFVEPVIKAIHLQWVFSCTTVAVGLFFVVFGSALKPQTVKVEKSAADKKTEKKGEKDSKDEAATAQEAKAQETKAQEAKAQVSTSDAAKENKGLQGEKDDNAQKITTSEKKEESLQLEGPKVNIKLSDESANAMTQTAMYDAVDKK